MSSQQNTHRPYNLWVKFKVAKCTGSVLHCNLASLKLCFNLAAIIESEYEPPVMINGRFFQRGQPDLIIKFLQAAVNGCQGTYEAIKSICPR